MSPRVENLAEPPSGEVSESRAPQGAVYRTGRNQQFNAKVTPETILRFYKLADEKRVPLGELPEARA